MKHAPDWVFVGIPRVSDDECQMFVIFFSPFLSQFGSQLHPHFSNYPVLLAFRFIAYTPSLAAPDRIWRSLLQAVCTRLTAVIPGAQGAGDAVI